LALKVRKVVFKTVVDLANKMIRMGWVILVKGAAFDLSKAFMDRNIA
jgi:hypothetical protein